jgi:hypothetical protein
MAANSILRKYYPNSPSMSNSRYPKYNKKFRKPLAAVRKNTHDIEGLERWFRKLQMVREEYRIVDQDIHNMDETGFRIGVGRKHKVITRASSKRQYLADPDNRDFITSIESCRRIGRFLRGASI